MESCLDFANEISELQTVGEAIDCHVLATPKFHAEIAGEGVASTRQPIASPTVCNSAKSRQDSIRISSEYSSMISPSSFFLSFYTHLESFHQSILSPTIPVPIPLTYPSILLSLFLRSNPSRRFLELPSLEERLCSVSDYLGRQLHLC